MTQAKIELPPLPKPEVWHVTWDGSPGWTQYHDERDPLPDKWDDEPPDVVEGFYSGDTLRAEILAERERCAKLCESLDHGAFGPPGYLGGIKDGSIGCANAIRKSS